MDNGNEGFEEDDWQHETRDGGDDGVSQSSLRANRWWVDPSLGQAGVRTQTRAAVWASAAISGPVLSGGVGSPTIFEEGVITTLAGGR